MPPNASTGWDFALLRDGCPLPTSELPAASISLNASTELPAFFASGGGVLSAFIPAGSPAPNGYRFRTAAGGSEAAATDPVSWVVEGSADGGRTWRTVGSSRWRFGLDGAVRLDTGPHATPAAPRGAAVEADHRPPAGPIALSCMWFGWNIGAYLVMLVLGLSRLAPRAVRLGMPPSFQLPYFVGLSTANESVTI